MVRFQDCVRKLTIGNVDLSKNVDIGFDSLKYAIKNTKNAENRKILEETYNRLADNSYKPLNLLRERNPVCIRSLQEMEDYIKADYFMSL